MISRAGTLLRVCCQAAHASRSLSMTPVTYKAATATDPVQQLFVEKVRLYAQKSKAAGGKLVDATPEVEAKYKAEMDRVDKTFGVTAGEDFTKFPTFNFQDTDLEPVGVQVEIKQDAAAEVEEVEELPHWIEAVKFLD